ncbi:hypothetical protein PSACC_02568 [Paramicrosporidium saccamoebae]|uniref:Uncharacterized protein n=1 Tax=Paramicrosporidium saccamoebae TaxID=1246581 RepID=A0A2H9TIP9_9FUNG|nr:hypothetical protein PSACC_02568 [Paramicrosporidium saccamoebae]
MRLVLFTLGILVGWARSDALDILDRAVHGELAGDQDFREEMEPILAPPADPPPEVPDTSLWDLEESEIAADAEKVDEWEALPLPASHHEEQMIRDSEEVGVAGSEAKRELEVLAEAWKGELLENEGEVKEETGGRVDVKVVVEDIQVFNTDDFDGRDSDVEGDSPLVPL